MKILYFPNEYSQQRQRQKKAKIFPLLMAMEAEYHRQKGYEVYWKTFSWLSNSCEVRVITEPQGLPFLDLPIPDRLFTRWWEYQDNGNFKYFPATYMQVANGCWWGNCTFCVEKENVYQVRNVDHVMQEIEECERLGFREIFDDSGTFPIKGWLSKFCSEKIRKGYEITLGCNMRIHPDVDFNLMKLAGFRMILFGIESANQSTLTKIHKGVYSEDIIPTIKKASDAGLDPHIAVMFGCPGESEKEELETLKLVHYLLRKGYAKTAQASVYRTKTFQGQDRGNVNKIYNAGFQPEFWFNKLLRLRNFEDWKYLIKQIRKGLFRD